MKVIKAESKSYISVETDEGLNHEYVRYSSDNWFVWIGESLESLYDCVEVEESYRQYIDEKRAKYEMF